MTTVFYNLMFQTGLISPGRERQEGLSLELNGVGRHDAGVYVCTATNGVGKPARAEITVEVKCKCGVPNCLKKTFILSILRVYCYG